MIANVLFLIVAATALSFQAASAQPIGLEDGISVRPVLSVARNTIKLAIFDAAGQKP